MPEQPQFSSSPTSMPSKAGSPRPPSDSGTCRFIRPELVRLRDDVDRVGRVLVVLGRLRPDLLLGELARERAELALLRRQRERDAAGDAGLHLGHDRRLLVRLTSQSIESTRRRAAGQAARRGSVGCRAHGDDDRAPGPRPSRLPRDRRAPRRRGAGDPRHRPQFVRDERPATTSATGSRRASSRAS